MWMLKHGLNYLSFARQEFAFQQSLIAQKKLGRVFAPACYLLSTWFSFENFFIFKSI